MSLMFVSVASIFMGASMLVNLVIIRLVHGAPAFSPVLIQASIGVGGLVLLAVGVGIMQLVRRLQ